MPRTATPRQFRNAIAAAWLGLVLILALAWTDAVRAQRPDTDGRGFDMWRPVWQGRESWDPKGMGPWRDQRIRRHTAFMLDGVPVEYRGQTNPLAMLNVAVIRQGGTIYARECAACHGPKGMGDGDAGKGLSPSPALLARLIRMPATVDEYLLWTIVEGGTALGTDMPAFKHGLEEKQIWQVITYLRAGFPPIAPAAGAAKGKESGR